MESRPNMITLRAELANTNGIGKKDGNLCFNLPCSASSTFPGYKASPEHLAEAELNLERDMKHCGFFEDKEIGVKLKEFRKVNIPSFIREVGNLDPLSPAGHIGMLVFGLIWETDDVIGVQEGHDNLFHFNTETLKLFFRDLIDILEGKSFSTSNYDVTMECNSHPTKVFLNKILLLQNKISENLKIVIPEFLEDRNRDGCVQTMRNYFQCYLWWVKHNPKVDRGVSKRTKTFWKLDIVGLALTFEYMSMLKGIFIEQEIRDDPMFKRVVQAGSSYCMTLNDLIGFGKDNQAQDYESCLYANYVDSKNVDETFQHAVKLCNEELEDYFVLSARLRDMYPENKNFQRYLDSMDSSTAGLVAFHTIAPRYGHNKYWVDGQPLFENEDAENNIRFMDSYLNILNSHDKLENNFEE